MRAVYVFSIFKKYWVGTINSKLSDKEIKNFNFRLRLKKYGAGKSN